MAQYPVFPLWTDAYLGDTTHLSAIEHGAYLLLLITMWRTPGCRLPNDEKLLARYAKLTAGQWRRSWPILEPFFTIENGYLTQGRLLDEYEAVKQKSKSRSSSAKARWLKRKKTNDAIASRSQYEPDAILSLSTITPLIPLEGDAKANGKDASKVVELPTPNPPSGKRTLRQAMDLTDMKAECFEKSQRLFAKHGWPEILWELVWEDFLPFWTVERPRTKKVDWPGTFYNRCKDRRTWNSYAAEEGPALMVADTDMEAAQRRARVRGLIEDELPWRDDWGPPPDAVEIEAVKAQYGVG